MSNWAADSNTRLHSRPDFVIFRQFLIMSDYKSITQWAADDRPREKLIAHGRQTLSTAELLAILLGSGSRDCSAVDLAKQILSYYDNSLEKLSKVSAQELCKNFKGVGTAKAVSIIAAMELTVRKGMETQENYVISSSEAAYKLLFPRLSDLAYEEFWVILLNNANKVLALKRLSMGGIQGTVVDKSILLKLAIDHLATGIILCHNHPSGTEKASAVDRSLTAAVKELCNILSIRLLDHIIICGENYLSFADDGIL